MFATCSPRQNVGHGAEFATLYVSDFSGLIGAPGKIRTPDPQIRSLVLYPAELPVLCASRITLMTAIACFQEGAKRSPRQASGRGSDLLLAWLLRCKRDRGFELPNDCRGSAQRRERLFGAGREWSFSAISVPAAVGGAIRNDEAEGGAGFIVLEQFQRATVRSDQLVGNRKTEAGTTATLR